MKLVQDGVWWAKHAVWSVIDRFVAWVIDYNNRAVDRDDL